VNDINESGWIEGSVWDSIFSTNVDIYFNTFEPENWLLKYLQISWEIWYPNSSISYGVTMEAEVETFQK